MTDTWIEFCRVLCRHRQGHSMALPYEVAVNHADPDNIARVLFMVPLPLGDERGQTMLAAEWAETEGAR